MASSASCFASNLGVGVSIDGDRSTIYVPIRLTDRFHLEGSLSYDHRESKISYSDDDEGTQTLKATSTRVALGGYWSQPLKGDFSLYMGPRIGFASISQSQSRGERLIDSKIKTWSLAPVAGVEYYPLKNLSISAEASFVYEHSYGSHNTESSLVASENDHYTYTDTALIFRYYF